MQKWKFALALAAFIVPATAQAILVTKSYTVNFTFNVGPVNLLQQTFTTTFDPTDVIPALTQEDANLESTYSVSSYFSSSNLPQFNGVIISGMRDLNGVSLYFSKPEAGSGIHPSSDDFSTRISVDDEGNVTSPFADILYSFAGAGRTFLTRGSVVQNTVSVPAVPEPATWAMMVLGLGFVGGMIRRRTTKMQAAAF